MSSLLDILRNFPSRRAQGVHSLKEDAGVKGPLSYLVIHSCSRIRAERSVPNRTILDLAAIECYRNGV